MKGYKIFIGISIALLLLYVFAAINKPEPQQWELTLSKSDKNPFGTYVLYNELKSVFPNTDIKSFREPLYNRLHKNNFTNTAYICIAQNLPLGKYDIKEMIEYVKNGNYLFLSADYFSEKLQDTLGFVAKGYFYNFSADSVGVNFVNPLLKADTAYYFNSKINPFSSVPYFNKLTKRDSIIVLGNTTNGNTNFIQIKLGKGAIFIHTDPLCFSNYAVLKANNASYAAKALSYLPSTVSMVMWDEYYNLGRGGAETPLRFFLTNTSLRWALWLAVIAVLLFMLFERKRMQRIIPVIKPLRNTTLDFTKTIATLYFHQKDNKGIAQKKIQFWLEFVRNRFYLSTQILDEEFIQSLYRKSSVDEKTIRSIINFSINIETENNIGDIPLLQLNKLIDSFYQSAK